MNLNPVIYVAMMSALLNAGCADKALLDDDTRADSNVVTFSAIAGAAADDVARSAEKEIFEPLELSDDESSATLYLHTYESERIGYDPAAIEVSNGSRAAQVDSPDALIKFHGNFKAHATLLETGADYIAWTDTRCKGSDNVEKNIWLPRRTEYWPAEQTLAFHAVSPAAELPNLKYLIAGENALTFSYSAQKGGDNADAVAQPDLLVATSVCNKATSDHGRAPLKFHHALSAVKFAIRDVLAGEIVNIRIAGVRSTGTCSYTFDQATGLGNLLWSDQEGSESFSQRFNYAVDDRGIIDPSDESKDIVLNDKMPEKTFMMIPQQIPDDAEIIVTLKRAGMTPEEITVRGKIKANNVKEWKPGHEYVYTISTSKDNWVYVLTATGNHDSDGSHNKKGQADYDGKWIYVYSPSESAHDDHGDNAYFKVTSFRYRANKPTHREILPWAATHGEGKQYRLDADGVSKYVPGHDLTASEWISDPLGLKGNGSLTPELHWITFAPHHQMTDWPGDEWLQSQDAYDNNSEENPWDLSTVGGKVRRNTANCYVIDREGWYSIPLYYGNAMTDGILEPATYNKDVFRNHADVTISSLNGKINPGQAVSADVVWSDVYNPISDISVFTDATTNEKMIRFHANKNNLQQGNTVLALYNSDEQVVWSWHIWITEHWLDTITGFSHALAVKYNQDTSQFDDFEESKSGWRQRGDLYLNSSHVKGYYLTPYNIGWCDPKNVDYLLRPGEMRFTQYQADGKTLTGRVASLTIRQDGAHIDYKYGNNTYYQWGRKDAMVGYVDHLSKVKRNFGPKQYFRGYQPKSQAYTVLNPQTILCRGAKDKEDWCTTPSTYYWNTGSKDNVQKTVYDPCPPGYKVPHGQVMQIIGKDNGYTDPKDGWKEPSYKNAYSNNTLPLENLNGVIVDDFTFRISATDDKTAPPESSFWFTSTGNRWYTDGRKSDLGLEGGDNFNPQIVYLWSTDPVGAANYGLALGKDNNDDQGMNLFVVCSYFSGRRAMGRPVRPIRE